MTSGDVTRELIAAGPRKVFHLGPERDTADLSTGSTSTWSRSRGEAVVCTGLFDDETETPEDYRRHAARGCARATCR